MLVDWKEMFCVKLKNFEVVSSVAILHQYTSHSLPLASSQIIVKICEFNSFRILGALKQRIVLQKARRGPLWMYCFNTENFAARLQFIAAGITPPRKAIPR